MNGLNIFEELFVNDFNLLDYMREPSDIAVSNREFYVCDFKVSNILQKKRSNIMN